MLDGAITKGPETVMGTQGEVKLQRIVDKYLVELLAVYSDNSQRRQPYSYFLDVSVLRGDYAALLSEHMLTWHLTTARFSKVFSNKYGRRLIRRVFPIAVRDYSEEEIRLIKYNLHFQLTLGLEIVVMFVDHDFIPESEFGTDNLALVKSRVLITSSTPYDPQVPTTLIITEGSDSRATDLYLHLESVSKGERACMLKYNNATFTAFKVSDLKCHYGWLLYMLQSGRCGLSGQNLDLVPWDIDHIIPSSMGGNNSLVNLQAARHKPNVEKGATMEHLGYALSPDELLRYQLSTTFHRRLSDRRLVGIPLGPESLHSLNPKLL